MPIMSFNLPYTTFISLVQPDMNLFFYPLIYVGTDPSYKNCTGLISVTLPQLPVNRVDSALLQLSVIVKSLTRIKRGLVSNWCQKAHLNFSLPLQLPFCKTITGTDYAAATINT